MKLENVMARLENFGSKQNRQTYKKHGVENEMFTPPNIL